MRIGQPVNYPARDKGGVHRGGFALDPERRWVALSQAFHGGQVLDAARELGLSHGSVLDFSSNLNVLAPTVAGAEWERWAADITRYPEPDAATLADRLAEIYAIGSRPIFFRRRERSMDST